MAASVLVPLAEGFEEIEAVAVIDILRRGGLAVTVAGLAGREVRGSHAIAVLADATLAEAAAGSYDAVVLPGGLPGTTNLGQSPDLRAILERHHRAGKVVAAICAAPQVLAAAGLLAGRRATCYPGVEAKLAGAVVTLDPVVVDGTVVTSRGVGTAVEFALKLVEILAGAPVSAKLRAGMLVG